MSESLADLFFNYRDSMPVLAALFLGLLTAVSPCPLATNITAIGFLGKDISSKKRVFLNGLLYTLGRTISYCTIALLILIGANQTGLSGFFQNYGEKIAGPFLLIAGVYMTGIIKFSFPALSFINRLQPENSGRGGWQAFFLGILFALAFCPYSGILFFGMLIPLTLSSPAGMALPVIFAIATGLPVLIFAWLIAYSISGVGSLYNRIKSFEKWSRKVVAILFIITGVYLILAAWFGVSINIF